MDFEDLQKAWQAQPARATVKINAEMLLKQVRRNQRAFWTTIFWRDVREVGVAAWLTWVFTRDAIRQHDWSLYVTAFCCFGVGLHMLVDRWRQPKLRPGSNDSLHSCLEASLIQVKHQIWLLKNVFWTYLLPLDIGMSVFFIHVTWKVPVPEPWMRLVVLAFMIVFSAIVVGGISWFVYWLNQFAVRKDLEPRREELESLLESLDQK